MHVSAMPYNVGGEFGKAQIIDRQAMQLVVRESLQVLVCGNGYRRETCRTGAGTRGHSHISGGGVK